jgi:uncharacterized membrane protein
MAKRIPSGLLLSHHPPCQYNRTLLIPWLNIRVCARCFGELVGMIMSLWLLVGVRPVPSYWLVMAVSVLTLPAIVDWSTQAIGWRESNNYLRILTGGMFAAACVQVGFFLRTASFDYFIAGFFLIAIEGFAAVKWLEVVGAFPKIMAPFEEYAETILKEE